MKKKETIWSSGDLVQRLAVYGLHSIVHAYGFFGTLMIWGIVGLIAYVYMAASTAAYVAGNLAALVAVVVFIFFSAGDGNGGEELMMLAAPILFTVWVLWKTVVYTHAAWNWRKERIESDRYASEVLFLLLARMPNIENISVRLEEPLTSVAKRRKYLLGKKPDAVQRGWTLKLPPSAHEGPQQVRMTYDPSSNQMECSVTTWWKDASGMPEPSKDDRGSRTAYVEVKTSGVGMERTSTWTDNMPQPIWSEWVFQELKMVRKDLADHAHSLPLSSFTGEYTQPPRQPVLHNQAMTGAVLSPSFDMKRVRWWSIRAKIEKFSLWVVTAALCVPWIFVCVSWITEARRDLTEQGMGILGCLVGVIFLGIMHVFLHFVYNAHCVSQSHILTPQSVRREFVSLSERTLKVSGVQLRLDTPFSIHLTQSHIGTERPRLGVSLTQSGAYGVSRAVFRVPIQPSAWVQSLPRLDSVAPELSGEDFDAWLWPTILYYARTHGIEVDELVQTNPLRT